MPATSHSHLRRHLTWAIVLKLLFLFGIWWFFVRSERPVVDSQATAARLLGSVSTPSPKEQP